ncbi:MAG: GNAT family N-acetyltransferase [Anaerovibrio sp.]
MKIEYGHPKDIDEWMGLVKKVCRLFPGLETEEALQEHKETVLEFMHRQSALCARLDDRLAGVLLFSRENSMLCFLAVEADCRRQHIAEKMVWQALSEMEPGRDVVVTTYREGVKEGIAARRFYEKLGFEAGRLTEEFGSPVQELVLAR